MKFFQVITFMCAAIFGGLASFSGWLALPAAVVGFGVKLFHGASMLSAMWFGLQTLGLLLAICLMSFILAAVFAAIFTTSA